MYNTRTSAKNTAFKKYVRKCVIDRCSISERWGKGILWGVIFLFLRGLQ